MIADVEFLSVQLTVVFVSMFSILQCFLKITEVKNLSFHWVEKEGKNSVAEITLTFLNWCVEKHEFMPSLIDAAVVETDVD